MIGINDWNRVVYALWAPVYDWFVNRGLIVRARRQALEMLGLEAGCEVLLVGVGTGADLPLLPAGVRATGIDLSAAMLARARAKLPLPGREITLRQANAEHLPFADASFDTAILMLILTVAGDGRKALQETLRTLRPGGRALIFDKFLRPGQRPSAGRRLLNALLMRPFGTDINRSLAAMIEGLPCQVLADQPSLFSGFYRMILIGRDDSSNRCRSSSS